MNDKIGYKIVWTVCKYDSDAEFVRNRPFETLITEGNLILNEGAGEALDLLAGTGSPTAFSNAAANIGVGDSTTAEAAGQVGLQGANKTYKAMASTYPQRSGTTTTWRAVFGTSDANYAWNEMTIANGNSDSAKNLNRKVSAQGSK